MEEVQIASNSRNKREGRDANLRVEVSKSNGHGRDLDMEGHMMKIIERLHKYAHACRDNI